MSQPRILLFGEFCPRFPQEHLLRLYFGRVYDQNALRSTPENCISEIRHIYCRALGTRFAESVFLNTILQYFTGLYVLRNGLYHALGVALKASQGEKRLNFVATTALSLLILWRLLCRRNRGCVRLTNERNKLCRDQLYNEERFASRACATTEELQVRFHFPHLVGITRREAKYDIEELYVNCLNFCDTKIVRSTR